MNLKKVSLRVVTKYQTIKSPFIQNYVSISEKVKEQSGRIIGLISMKYYHEIRENAYKQNIYTYELKAYSKTENVFLVS